MEKVLVTGAAGFIGFHVVKKLIGEGLEVVGIDNIDEYYDVHLKYGRLAASGINRTAIQYNVPMDGTLWRNYKFIKLDLKDTSPVLELFGREQFQYVIHLAAQAGVRYSLVNPYAYIDSNVYGFLNILEGCRHRPVNHLLFASSSSVYGANSKIPFEEEDDVDNPVSLYAATKKSNELFAHSYSHLYNIPVTGLRFFTVYGPWGRPDMAYFSFTKAVLEGQPIKVFNEGRMMRDFTYIDDATYAISKLRCKPPERAATIPENSSINIPDPAYALFNIGNSSPVALMDFIKEIEMATGKGANMQFLPMQPGDVPATYADVSKLENKVGTMPTTNIKEGIISFVDWYREYYKA